MQWTQQSIIDFNSNYIWFFLTLSFIYLFIWDIVYLSQRQSLHTSLNNFGKVFWKFTAIICFSIKSNQESSFPAETKCETIKKKPLVAQVQVGLSTLSLLNLSQQHHDWCQHTFHNPTSNHGCYQGWATQAARL